MIFTVNDHTSTRMHAARQDNLVMVGMHIQYEMILSRYNTTLAAFISCEIVNTFVSCPFYS
jgi:hypothetical protein